MFGGMAVQTGIAMINEENLEVASVQSNDDFTILNPSQSYPDDLDLIEENFIMVCKVCMKSIKTTEDGINNVEENTRGLLLRILNPRAYNPSGLRQESRALGATISGMRHRCRCAVSRITRIRLFPLFFHNGCSQSSRFLLQARRIVGSGDENGYCREEMTTHELNSTFNLHLVVSLYIP